MGSKFKELSKYHSVLDFETSNPNTHTLYPNILLSKNPKARIPDSDTPQSVKPWTLPDRNPCSCTVLIGDFVCVCV